MELSLHELHLILDAVNETKTGDKSLLCRRIFNLLETSFKSTYLEAKIFEVYSSKSQQTSIQPNNLHGNNFVNPLQALKTPITKFEQLPFFKILKTLIKPFYCTINSDVVNLSGDFFLGNNFERLVTESWSISKQEHKIQIILKIARNRPEENYEDCLPSNLKIYVNNSLFKLPTLNITTILDSNPWRCHVPIDLTPKINLSEINILRLNWSEDPHQYIAGVFVAHKLTYKDLIKQLNEKPLRPFNKTKELIKNIMKNDGDLDVDSMAITLCDPLSQMRMQLPIRGIDCIHIQCFDAIQFLQMNELKQSWICPLCKKNAKFESIEVDEFFLNILKSPNLSKECNSVNFLCDGSWTERIGIKEKSASNTKDQSLTSNIEIITLSDTVDENDDPPIKRSKYSLAEGKQPKISFEQICNAINVPNDDLEMSSKNYKPSTSSEYRPFPLSGNSASSSSTSQSSNSLKDKNKNGSCTELTGVNSDLKPCNSGNSRTNEHREKVKSKPVLFVITLD